MYTKGTTIEKCFSFIVPPLPKEALFKLPKYCPKPNKNNLATQYYYWNKELLKENRELRRRNQELKNEKLKLKKRIEQLKKEKQELELQRNRFLRMLFKPKRKKNIGLIQKKQTIPRLKQSYVRPVPEKIDEQKQAILKQCPHCKGKLSQKVDSYQRIIEDIPCFQKNKVKVIQYTIHRYYCKKCKKIVSAKPIQALPRSRLGINTLMYVLYSKYRLRLSQNLIRENLETYFNLKVSEGEITNLLNKGQQVFRSKWQEIIEIIKHSKSVNADETSWRINGEKHWLWAFAADKAVRYTISEFRGKGVPQKVLNKDYKGVVGCDFYAAYNQFKRKQRCWVHLLRKIRELTQQNPTKQVIQIYHKLNRIYKQILVFRSKTNQTTKQKKEKAELIRNQLLQLSRIKTNDYHLQKVLNLCNKYAGELVVCIRQPNVSPDNNSAERALRPAVVMRKISGGSRSKQGALTHEVNLSVIRTLCKQKHSLFEAMQELILGYAASIG